MPCSVIEVYSFLFILEFIRIISNVVLFKTLVMTVSCSSSVDTVTKISSIIPMTFLENTVSRFCWNMS